MTDIDLEILQATVNNAGKQFAKALVVCASILAVLVIVRFALQLAQREIDRAYPSGAVIEGRYKITSSVNAVDATEPIPDAP